MKIIIAALMLLTSSARADEWNAVDLAGQGAVYSVLAADMVQTLDLTRDCLEFNPVMGSCGQRVPVIPYFVGVAAAHTALAHVLPRKWRRVSQGVIVAVQSVTVARNWHFGYAVQF